MKNYFLSQNVLPHDQQQRIRLIQTVTIKKAEIHSNTSLRNKYLRYLGEELGKLSCSKYQRSGRNCPFPESHQKKGSVSLFRDQFIAMRQNLCNIFISLARRTKSEFGEQARAIFSQSCAYSWQKCVFTLILGNLRKS